MEMKSEVIKEQRERISPSGSKEEWHGESEDKCVRMKWMYYEKEGDIIVPTHPKEDVNMSGKD